MIQSMTGFGKSSSELPNKKIYVEIKSLNSKQFDLNTRIPFLYREKEMEIRNNLLQSVERGKVDFSIYVENIGKASSSQINQNALESYYNQIKEVSQNLQISIPADWFSVLLRMPEVMKTEMAELDENEWEITKETIKNALEQFTLFRNQEGSVLQKLFENKISNISLLLNEIEKYELERIEKVKVKILDSLQKMDLQNFDTNRFEQELIYYIEKLDVNEEKIRLNNHLKYFIDTMNNEKSQGRKLGFIAQEIGREINTLGSKSNHAEMQKIVVQMKDELEQIKEQILNVL
ncbi:MAG: YicC family protein [Dysgonamonadaceae bacterium]|nr:YicC family protein [Dysgonamonadaceae bacterium]